VHSNIYHNINFYVTNSVFVMLMYDDEMCIVSVFSDELYII
jgi:hypothetical protein